MKHFDIKSGSRKQFLIIGCLVTAFVFFPFYPILQILKGFNVENILEHPGILSFAIYPLVPFFFLGFVNNLFSRFSVDSSFITIEKTFLVTTKTEQIKIQDVDSYEITSKSSGIHLELHLNSGKTKKFLLLNHMGNYPKFDVIAVPNQDKKFSNSFKVGDKLGIIDTMEELFKIVNIKEK